MEFTYLSGFLIVFITYTIVYILVTKYSYDTVEDSVAVFVDYFWTNLGVNLLLSLICITALLICFGRYMLLKYIIMGTQFGKFLIYKIFG